MRLLTLLVTIQMLLAITSLFILCYKYFLLKGYTHSSKRPIRLKWIGFYDSWEISSTSSEIRRSLMQRNNTLSVALWTCFAFIAGLAILESRMPEGL